MRKWSHLPVFKFFVLLVGCGMFFNKSMAQLPRYGIYELKEPQDIQLNPALYVNQIVNTGSFYRVNLIQQPEINLYNFTFALVAVNLKDSILKIVLLRDTVSATWKQKRSLQKATNYYLNSNLPVYAWEYKIVDDSLADFYRFDSYFPERPHITGNWLLNQPYNDYITFFNPMPQRKSLQRYDSLKNRYQNGSSFTFQQSVYEPVNYYSPYKDLIYSTKNVPIYKNPGTNKKPASSFHEGEYIAVHKDSANWYKTDRVIITVDTNEYYNPFGNNIKNQARLKIISGWVRKEDVVSDTWVKQKQQTKRFRFEAAGNFEGEDYSIYKGSVDAVKIINKKTDAVQILMNMDCVISDSLDDVVQIQDCNFDGYPDIMVFAHDGGAGPNYGYNFYLYNPRNEQFEYNEKLSALTQVSVDSKTRTISSAFRDGCCHHGGATYTFMGDTLTEIANWDDDWGYNYFGEYHEGNLIHGQWQDSTCFEGNITVDSASVFPSPNENGKAIFQLYKADIVSIKKENPLWFYVEGSRNKDLKTGKGWIKKTDILPQQYMPFSSQTNLYRFAAATEDSTLVAAIVVIEKAGNKIVQIIPKYKAFEFADSLFQTGDFNHDGHPDFRIKNIYYEQPSEDDYIFNPEKQLFFDKTIRHIKG